MYIDIEISESVSVDIIDIVREVKRGKLSDIIDLRNDINDIIEEKGGEPVGGGGLASSLLPKYLNTIPNNEKMEFLIEHILDISMEQLENLIKK